MSDSPKMFGREFVFRGVNGCSNHGCIVHGKRTGMGTNGPCHCVQYMQPSQLNVFAQRLGHHLTVHEEMESETASLRERLRIAVVALENLGKYPRERCEEFGCKVSRTIARKALAQINDVEK